MIMHEELEPEYLINGSMYELIYQMQTHNVDEIMFTIQSLKQSGAGLDLHLMIWFLDEYEIKNTIEVLSRFPPPRNNATHEEHAMYQHVMRVIEAAKKTLPTIDNDVGLTIMKVPIVVKPKGVNMPTGLYRMCGYD